MISWKGEILLSIPQVLTFLLLQVRHYHREIERDVPDDHPWRRC